MISSAFRIIRDAEGSFYLAFFAGLPRPTKTEFQIIYLVWDVVFKFKENFMYTIPCDIATE